MRFVVVDEIPKSKTGAVKRSDYHKYDLEFQKFLNMNVKVARVEFFQDEYASVRTARNVLRGAVKRYCVPIKVCIRSGEIYFVRTDM